jgi:hypothetical protein
VLVADVISIPAGIVVSSFYGYGGSGYMIAETIVPGRAYWVRVSQSGRLVFR